MELIKTDKERVVAAVLKKGSWGDPINVRKVVDHFSDLYSISITKEDIEAVIAAARMEAEAKKLGGAEKFFIGTFAAKVLGQSR